MMSWLTFIIDQFMNKTEKCEWYHAYMDETLQQLSIMLVCVR